MHGCDGPKDTMTFGFGAPHLRKCEKEGEQRRILFDLQKQRDIIILKGIRTGQQDGEKEPPFIPEACDIKVRRLC